jgi:hypothetical protein
MDQRDFEPHKGFPFGRAFHRAAVDNQTGHIIQIELQDGDGRADVAIYTLNSILPGTAHPKDLGPAEEFDLHLDTGVKTYRHEVTPNGSRIVRVRRP